MRKPTAFRSPRSMPTSIVVVQDKMSIGGCSYLTPKSVAKAWTGMSMNINSCNSVLVNPSLRLATSEIWAVCSSAR